MNETLIGDLPPKMQEQLAEIAVWIGASETDVAKGLVRILGNILTDILNSKPEGPGPGPRAAFSSFYIELLKGIKPNPEPPVDPYPDVAEWERAVDEWSEETGATPIPDWALSREHIYGGRA
jgi:hypothetical protein